jgi:hypothetical protein
MNEYFFEGSALANMLFSFSKKAFPTPKLHFGTLVQAFGTFVQTLHAELPYLWIK